MKRTALVTAAVLSAATSVLAVQAGAGGAVVVKTAFNKTLGRTIVVDNDGRTLYMFTTDLDGKDTVCTPKGPYGAECPAIWPPLTSAGPPHGGNGIKTSLLGVYRRIDDKRQVTYVLSPDGPRSASSDTRLGYR